MSTPGTFAIHTLGCKLNFSESSSLSKQLVNTGWQPVHPAESADVYILNTCSVTEFADKKCRQQIRKFHRQNHEAKIIVTGCFAQLQPETFADINGVSAVLGAAEKFNLVQTIQNLNPTMSSPLVSVGVISDVNEFVPAHSTADDRTRTFLKVQDGCDYKCSFCTIPQARGKSRSATVEAVCEEVKQLQRSGTKEIVLTGVNIGDFKSNHGEDFFDLIQQLDQIDGVERIRISSIEPNLCHDQIIDFVASSNRFMPHFHMPLQSGSDRILGLMKRRYRSDLYRNRVERIKKVMPHASIGVDVITGFPGETEQDFLDTMNFLQDLDVSYFHVFTYSARANTPAAEMDQIPLNIRRERNERLRNLSSKKRHHHMSSYLNESRPVLWEKRNKKGDMEGYTDNYIRVHHSAKNLLSNEVQSISLNGVVTDKAIVIAQ